MSQFFDDLQARSNKEDVSDWILISQEMIDQFAGATKDHQYIHVDPERAKEVAAWARAGQDLLSASPGYLGSGWIRPDPHSPEWHMLFRFADAESLAAWQASPERAWWMASALGMVEHTPEERRTGI